MQQPNIISVRNVNGALPEAVHLFCHTDGYRTIAPRDSTKVTRELNTPNVTVYGKPLERVLYWPQRDANPFFHLLESMWILAGRDDVEWLERVLPRMADYSDDGKVFHGAYGARMRQTACMVHGEPHMDQLGSVIEQLKHDPASRRAVVALYQPDLDCGYSGKDMPCNTTLTFKVREGRVHMSIFNRSNDVIWGAYGANVVQFAFVLEYVAAMLALPVGTMYQWSDSFHVYESEPSWQRCCTIPLMKMDPYDYAPASYDLTLGHAAAAFGLPVQPYPLVHVPDIFDTELNHFVNYAGVAMGREETMQREGYDNTFLDGVARPMLNAMVAYKKGSHHAALSHVADIRAGDWRLAALLWLTRRGA